MSHGTEKLPPLALTRSSKGAERPCDDHSPESGVAQMRINSVLLLLLELVMSVAVTGSLVAARDPRTGR